jgi:nucleoside phosphorylase
MSYPVVSVLMGDVFEGGADLTVLPCGAKPSWTSSVQRWIDRFGIPTPRDLMPQMRLGDLTPVASFPGPPGLTKWIAYGASVFNDRTTIEAIRNLGKNIGLTTIREPSIRIVESVLFGTGHGRLGDVEAATALRDGFLESADGAASLIIYLHGFERFEAVKFAIERSSASRARSNSEETTMQADCVILTALPKELSSVLMEFRGFNEVDSGGGASSPCFGTYSPNGLRVIASAPSSMGNMAMAALTQQVVAQFNPATILLVGIAGAMDREISLGDVVASEQVVDYEIGKVTPQGVGPRWSVYRPDAALLSRAKSWPSQNWQRFVRAPRPDSGEPKLRFGDYLSGNKVIADSSTAGALKSVWRKAAAVEMEAAGVLSALYHMKAPPAFMAFKGVCDYADEQKDDRWQEYAASTAAACAFSFVIDHLRPADVGRTGVGGSQKPSTSGVDQRGLRLALSSAFDSAELRVLCFDLGIDWDEIGGDNKSGKIVGILEYARRRNLYNRLVDLVNSERDGLLEAYEG